MDTLRKIFQLLNKFFMIPMLRLGIGPLMGNPLSGYFMLLEVVGRKTGKTRYTPLNYTLIDGGIYCMAGFGKHTHWLLNLQANPKVIVHLPGRTFIGEASMVDQPDLINRAARGVMRSAGIAGFLEGYNPFTITDEQLKKTLERGIMVRITPIGVPGSPLDYGGWFWIVSWVLWALLFAWLFDWF